MSIPHHSTHSAQLLSLFEQGVTPAEISRALGITPGAVTQLMQSEDLAPKISEIREAQLARSASLDIRYDNIEERLADQLERTIPMLLKPEQILNALEKVNRMKRRGISLTNNAAPAQVVHLHLPATMIAKVTTNISNQVISVGGQQLITMQSQNIAKLAEANYAPYNPQIEQEDEFGFTNPRP